MYKGASAKPEECNHIDDDCDGILDNNRAETICGTGMKCDQGLCVAAM